MRRLEKDQRSLQLRSMSRYYGHVLGFGNTCAGLVYRFVLSLRTISIYALGSFECMYLTRAQGSLPNFF